MCSDAMAHSAPRSASPYVVAVPRASDAVGAVLRDAYDRDRSIPDDMASLLQQLNGNGGMRPYN